MTRAAPGPTWQRPLREAGFENVEVFFQVPEMAIFGGVRKGR